MLNTKCFYLKMEHPCSSLPRRHLLFFANNAFCGWNPKKRKVEYCLLRTGTLKMKVHLNSQKYNKSLGVLNTFFKCYIIQRNNWQAVVSHKKFCNILYVLTRDILPSKNKIKKICLLRTCIFKGGKFLKKLWCCVGGSIAR